MKKILDLRQKRAGLANEARAILDKAEAEKRDLSAEEQERWDRLMEEVEATGRSIERLERMAGVEAELGEAAEEPMRPEPREQPGAGGDARSSEAYRRGFAAFLRYGWREIGPQEMRALQVDVDSQGGFLVTPTQFVEQMLKDVDDLVFLRQRATRFSVATAQSLGAPRLEADPADADWTTELKTGSEDTAMKFGGRELHPHPLAKRIKVSRTLLRKLPNVENFVRQRLAYKFAVTEEKAFLTGNGAMQPLGLFTASPHGISTGRDVSTGNTTTALTFDGLIEVKYSLKQQYWGRAEWLFHRDALKMLAKIKDGEGQYVWRESVRAGEPDMLLGRPFLMSEHAPHTFTAGKYVGMFGDFSYYWIADALQLEVQRLEELYSETNQVGLIGRLECDGQPVLEEAFVRVKLAAS